MLQPRKFRYKTRQKNRSAKITLKRSLTYGTAALIVLKPFQISAKRIFRLRLFLKRSSRKADLTKRAFWLAIFPHLPLSRKPKGMRMGKGAGKLSSWHTQIRGGKTLAEFRNLRLGRAHYFSKQLNFKLPVPSVFWTEPSRRARVVGARRLNAKCEAYW